MANRKKLPHIEGIPEHEGWAGWCLHYTGMLADRCAKRIRYEDVAIEVDFTFTRHPGKTKYTKTKAHPCFRREESLNGNCILCEFPSARQIAEKRTEDDKLIAELNGATVIVAEAIAKQPHVRIHQGKILCPKCAKDTLLYSYHREARALTVVCENDKCTVKFSASGVTIE